MEDKADILKASSSRFLLIVLLLSFLVIVFFFIDILVGSVSIPVLDIFSILSGGESVNTGWNTIIMDVRLPRSVTAILAGAALSVSGLLMQTIFRNPLAGPFVLGISSGASLGVAIVVLGFSSIIGFNSIIFSF